MGDCKNAPMAMNGNAVNIKNGDLSKNGKNGECGDLKEEAKDDETNVQLNARLVIWSKDERKTLLFFF